MPNLVSSRIYRLASPSIVYTYILLFFSFTIPKLVKSQQLPLFTQYRDYPGYLNPAAVVVSDLMYARSLNNFHTIGFSHRRQWIGRIPTSYSSVARYDVFLNRKLNYLAGAYVMNDNAGAVSFTSYNGRLAIYVGEPSKSFFGLGFTAGGNLFHIETNRLAAYNLDDPLISVNSTTHIHNIGVGFFGASEVRKDHKLYYGVSAPRLFNLELALETNADGSFTYDHLRHIYSNIGFIYNTTKFGSDEFTFVEASIWGKYVQGLPKYHLDFNLRVQFMEEFWIGMGYSNSHFLHGELGLNVNLKDFANILKIGYGISYPMTSFSSYLLCTHEINLIYFIDK